MKPTLILIALLIVFAITIAVHLSDHAAIKRWASERGAVVIVIDERVFNRGPFWFTSRGGRVYHVEIAFLDGHRESWWVRFDLRMDVKRDATG